MSDEHNPPVTDDMLGPIEGAECCILEICCGGEEQIEALAGKLRAALPWLSRRRSLEVAAVVIERWDLAPAGSLRVFKRAISKLARAYPPNPGY